MKTPEEIKLEIEALNAQLAQTEEQLKLEAKKNPFQPVYRYEVLPFVSSFDKLYTAMGAIYIHCALVNKAELVAYRAKYHTCDMVEESLYSIVYVWFEGNIYGCGGGYCLLKLGGDSFHGVEPCNSQAWANIKSTGKIPDYLFSNSWNARFVSAKEVTT